MIILYFAIILVYLTGNPQTKWNWAKIDTEKVDFMEGIYLPYMKHIRK